MDCVIEMLELFCEATISKDENGLGVIEVSVIFFKKFCMGI
jgi:hypothetical protein